MAILEGHSSVFCTAKNFREYYYLYFDHRTMVVYTSCLIPCQCVTFLKCPINLNFSKTSFAYIYSLYQYPIYMCGIQLRNIFLVSHVEPKKPIPAVNKLLHLKGPGSHQTNYYQRFNFVCLRFHLQLLTSKTINIISRLII